MRVLSRLVPSMHHWVYTGIIAIILAGCVTRGSVPVEEAPSTPADTPEETVEPQPPKIPFQGRKTDPTSGRAVTGPIQKLLTSAEQAWKTGEHQRALSLVDRAYRLNPKEPLVHLHHSRYNFGLARYEHSESWARRALSIAGLSQTQRREAWQLIAQSRSRLGDVEGAAKAWSKIEDLQ